MSEVELTPEERREFTAINAAAFDLCRVESQLKGEIPPVWLCMSEQARKDCRKRLCEYLRANEPRFRSSSEAQIEFELAMAATGTGLVEQWRNVELMFKRRRAKGGDPHAFFAR